MWKILVAVILGVLLTGCLYGEPTADGALRVSQYFQYILGVGIFSTSYSVLTLMRAEKLLALPITFLSVLLAYAAEVYLGANFFIILFGVVMAASTIVGYLLGEEDRKKLADL